MSDRAFIRTQFTAILSQGSLATLLQRIAAAGVSVLSLAVVTYCNDRDLLLIKLVVGLPFNPDNDVAWNSIVRGILANLKEEERRAACHDPCAPTPIRYSQQSVVYLNYGAGGSGVPGILSAFTTNLLIDNIKVEALYYGELTSFLVEVPDDQLAQALAVAQNLPVPPIPNNN